jgi:virginiamycin B lyase
VRRIPVSAFLLAALLAGCGSATPHIGASVAPANSPSASDAHSAQSVSVAFNLTPSKSPSAAGRRPAYISYATQSATVSVSSAGSPTTQTIINCVQGSCSGSVDAPVGTDTFSVSLYDQANGRGAVLSAGATTTTIVANHANSVFITFDGVADHMQYVALENASPLIGGTRTSAVYVAVADADNYTIIGPGRYNKAIQLSISDPSGATSLSTNTVTSPADSVVLTYNGTPKIVATVSATIQGTTSTASTVFEPANVAPEYTIPTANAGPMDVVKGPDNNIWFTEYSGHKVAKIDASGLITPYATAGAPSHIVVGPDGNIWFTEIGNTSVNYARINPSDGGLIEYRIALTPYVFTYNLAFGPNGDLYFSDSNANKVYEVTPLTGAVVKTYVLNSQPFGIGVGPDNAVWVGSHNNINRLHSADAFADPFPTSGDIVSVATGADGNVWFADAAAKVGKVSTTTETVTEYPVPRSATVYAVIPAADGTHWYVSGNNNGGTTTRECRIGQITSTGTISSYEIADCNTEGLAFGSDGKLWLAEFSRAKIGVFSP